MPSDAQRAGYFFLSLACMGALIALNTWCFRRFGGVNYLEWYLEEGAVISLGASFVGVVFEGLRLQRDLISAHPARYLAACFGTAGMFFYALSVHFDRPISSQRDQSAVAGLAGIWDLLVALLLALPIFVLVLAWIFVVGPLNYVVTLFSGALGRQQLRGLRSTCVVTETDKEVAICIVQRGGEHPKGAVDVSLARDPFVLTQALASLVLWLAGMAWEKLA